MSLEERRARNKHLLNEGAYGALPFKNFEAAVLVFSKLA
jgi:hypothetical protein